MTSLAGIKEPLECNLQTFFPVVSNGATMEDSGYKQDSEVGYPEQNPVSQLPMFRHNGKLYISEGAELPSAICINCGKPSVKVVRKALRNPYNPVTWIGRMPRVDAGLCKQHNESFNIMRALAFSLLGVGLLIFIVGVVKLAIGSILVGLLTMFFCGIFRSLKPIWSPNTRIEPIEIRGTGKPFRALYPDVGPEDR